ncbi:MAG: rhodanese-like domain-containing protein [Pseudomonadota bacterium]
MPAQRDSRRAQTLVGTGRAPRRAPSWCHLGKGRAGWLALVRDASIAVIAAALLGLSVNALRRDGSIPLVAKAQYQILVPCPVVSGEVTPMAASDPRLHERGTLVVDARSSAAYEAWHFPDARNVPFDYLEPTPQCVIADIAGSGATLVVAYGDGDDPDTGHELASELSLKGIRNVYSVTGGAPALGAPAVPRDSQ